MCGSKRDQLECGERNSKGKDPGKGLGTHGNLLEGVAKTVSQA
jgi:hypothetical protein